MSVSPPKTPPLHCDLTTLSPLPPEVISPIYAYYLAQNPLESRSQFLNLITLSKEIYSENAWRLYEAIELNDQNHKAFFDGLWNAEDVHVCQSQSPCSPFLRCETSTKEFAREMETYSHPKRELERPSHIPSDSDIPYPKYEYESYIPFHLHPAIRKVLLIRQCRRLCIDGWEVIDGLRMGNDSVQNVVTAWPRGHVVCNDEAFDYTWISDPLFFSVTHLSFGENVGSYCPPTQYKCFGPALKHVYLSFNDRFYDLEGEFVEAARFGILDRFEERLPRKRITKLLQERLSFALRSEVDEKTSLTLHNAWPDDIEPGLADTMIYELPRSMKNGDGDWKRQLAMTTWEMKDYMSELEERMKDDRFGVNVWRPTMKPWKIRFTNMAPIPPNTDIISAVLDDYPLGHDEHFDGLFRKWWEEVVSFEGPVKCDCCEIFNKKHPKINAYKYSYNTRWKHFKYIQERADKIREEYESRQSVEGAIHVSKFYLYDYSWL
ncbi:hypothetical protein L198_07958 [Cryptococcus wingfieldii CBS 7118]|uniref:Uncharacterized protein n=1 Tax=Cryptococcus wingfieldii CBS 7118 TaxID=1295528 RepID=A0A1E3HRU8_9TREE|nr:hypothetical protein L198_07958 [Cryptococcus wingfieldii CBS 7118]ODN79074.1 hypothetical protein L198_07958 [Cryptococcus wingfieldii CBS 7118]